MARPPQSTTIYSQRSESHLRLSVGAEAALNQFRHRRRFDDEPRDLSVERIVAYGQGRIAGSLVGRHAGSNLDRRRQPD
jgi:hypothetical protein